MGARVGGWRARDVYLGAVRERRDDGARKVRASASETPDLIVLSSSLWHVLHDNSVSTYKSAMKTLGARAREMTAMKPNVVFVWLDAPKIVTDALVADDKRAKFTEKNFEKFFKVRDDQKTTALVAPAGPAIRVRATDVTAGVRRRLRRGRRALPIRRLRRLGANNSEHRSFAMAIVTPIDSSKTTRAS